MTNKVEVQVLEPDKIMLTEYNPAKSHLTNPEFFDNTPYSVREAIENGQADLIPPIVVIKNPFKSIEDTKSVYRITRESFKGIHSETYEKEEAEVLEQLLSENPLLCYNGNRRLEEFQKAQRPIKAYVITSQEEFNQIPEKEVDARANEITSSNYAAAFLLLLHKTVSLKARQKHFEKWSDKRRQDKKKGRGIREE